MKKGYFRLLSFLTAMLLVLSTMFTYPAKAVTANGTTAPKVDVKKVELARNALMKHLDSKVTSISKVSGAIDDNATQSKDAYLTENVDPNETIRVIVQLDENAVKDYAGTQTLSNAASNQTLVNKVVGSQQNYKSQIQRIDYSVRFRKSYSILMNGFSLETKRKNILAIERIPGVKHVTLVKEFYPDINYAKSLTNVFNVWNNLDYKGEGLVVAIIDTGTDYTHKDMQISEVNKGEVKLKNTNPEGPGIYFTLKVPYGHNFADDNNDVVDRTSSMHGMHVSGIVAANCQDTSEIAANLGVKGVAPEAQLLAMKVFSNRPAESNSAFSDDIVAAIEDSVRHGADVINMSLGSTASFQDPEDAEQVAIREANNSGTVVVVSAGNSYYSTWPYKFDSVVDTGLVGSPGIAHESLQVASFENSDISGPALSYTTGGTTGLAYYTTSEINPEGVLNNPAGYDIVNCGIGQVSDFQGKDLTGKIALIQRGTLNFADKKINAQAANAAGVIIYNNAAGYINMATDPRIVIPGIFISKTDGENLRSLIASGVKIMFKGDITSIPNLANGNMSDFTSWGPTPNLDFKPQITAPGGSIWSTVNNNQYENMSGTSMAAPHMSGITALIIQHINNTFPNILGKDKAELAKTLAVNTAVPKLDPITGTTYFSPRRQGAGLADAEAAIKNFVTVTDVNGEAAVALKEISGSTKAFTLNLHNYGTQDVTYAVTDLSGVLTEQYASVKTSMSYDIKLSGASVMFNSNQVTVPAGGNAVVDVTLDMSGVTRANIFAEGFIRFVPIGAEVPTIGIPYMGFYGSWDEPEIIDAPIWDPNTIFGETTLYTMVNGKYYYLGYTGTDGGGYPVINPGKIAISALAGANDNVLPYATLFRNARETITEIVDKDGRVVRTLAIVEKLRKTVINTTEQIYGTVIPYSTWDGRVYNSSKAIYEPAENGQYYLQIRNVIDYPNANYQTFKMPVLVDSIAPVVGNITMAKNQNGKYNLSFKVGDEGAGLSDVMIVVNGDFDNPVYPSPAADGNYSIADVAVTNNGEKFNTFEVYAFDYAGNVGWNQVQEFADTTKLEAVFDNIEPGKMLLTSDLKDGCYTVTGKVTTIPKVFKIADKDVTVNSDLTIKSQPIPYVDGLNKISIYLEAYSGEINEYAINTYYDAYAPVLTFDGMDSTKSTINVYVPENTTSFTLSGKVSDNPSFGYDLFVNGDQVIDVDLSSFPKEGVEKIFSKTINLVNEVTTIEVKAVDFSQNVTIKTIIVTKDKLGNPTLTITNPRVKDANGVYQIVGKTLSISGRIDNLNKGYVSVSINDDKFVLKNTSKSVSFTKTITLNNYGLNDVFICAVDSIGKKVEVKIVVEAKEMNRPVIKFISPATAIGETTNSTFDVLFSVTDETMDDLKVTAVVNNIDNTVIQTSSNMYKTTVQVPQNSRTYTYVTIKAEDKWHNVSTQTIRIKYAADSKGPVLTIVEPTVSRVSTDNVTLKIKAIDNEQSPIQYVEIYKGYELVAVAQYNSGSGCYEAVVNLKVGKNSFVIKSADSLGNLSSINISVTRR